MNIIQKFLIIFVLLMPAYLLCDTNFTKAQVMVAEHQPTHGDQDGIYQTFKGAFDGQGQIPPGIQNGWMAVGYLSLIGFYHKASMLWTTPDIFASYVYNGFIYGILAALISILLMFKVVVDQSPSSNRLLLAIACLLYWFAMFKLSIILKFIWLPWSHYAAAFVGISFVACVYQFLISRKIRWAGLLVFFATLFLFTRRHEAMAVFSGCGVVSVFYIVHQFFLNKKVINRNTLIKVSFVLFLSIILAVFFIHFFSNNMPFNSHYAQQRQYDSFVNEYLKIYPDTIPTRFIQTFFDPNFYSYGNTYKIQSIIHHGFTLPQFAMPLIFQLPILWFMLPFALFIFFYLIVSVKEWKNPIQPAVLMFLLGFLSFSILTCGYLGTAVWSGVHLKNGLAREFILSLLLLCVATGPALYIFLSNQFHINRIKWMIPVVGIFFMSYVWGENILIKHPNLLVFPATHISFEKSKSTYHCKDGICHVELSYVNEQGQTLTPPFDYVILNFNCSSGIQGTLPGINEAGMTTHGNSFDFKVIQCKSPVNVEVTPLITGYCGSGESTVFKFRD